MADDKMKAAYLFHGSDQAKIDRARSRLRERIRGENGGEAALEVFEPSEGKGSPDAEAMAQAVGAMSLIPGRRYLLADGIEKWGKRQASTLASALVAVPAETTVVLIARGKVPAEIVTAVKQVGGEILKFEAPEGAALIHHLVAESSRRGFTLEPEAARLLVARMGERLTRLENELDRLALWAGPAGTVSEEQIASSLLDESEVGPYALGDALVAGERAEALAVAERLLVQGERPGGLIYRPADAVRRAHKALALAEEGLSPGEIESRLGVPPFVARRLMAAASGTTVGQARGATVALSDLELWLRGGAEYPEDLALDLALVAAT